jgi:hypothetical protein
LARLDQRARLAALAAAGLMTAGTATAAAAAVTSGPTAATTMRVPASAMADALGVKTAHSNRERAESELTAKTRPVVKARAAGLSRAAVRARQRAHAEHVAHEAGAASDRAAARAQSAAGSRPAAPAAAAQVQVAQSPEQIAQALLASHGWSSDQWTYLYDLWQRESAWNPSATNPGSGAYGIPQALPASLMASAGPDWQTNPATQIKWGLDYIAQRYGSPAAAWAHEQANGWY